MESYSIFLFATGLFHLALCPQSSCFCHVPEFPSFLMPNIILLYISIIIVYCIIVYCIYIVFIVYYCILYFYYYCLLYYSIIILSSIYEDKIPHFIHLSMDTFTTSIFWLLWIILLWTWVINISWRLCFQFFWVYIYSEVELLDHMILLFLLFWGIIVLFA